LKSRERRIAFLEQNKKGTDGSYKGLLAKILILYQKFQLSILMLKSVTLILVCSFPLKLRFLNVEFF